MSDHGMQLAAMPLDQLQQYHRNPRRGHVDAIRNSLRRNGQYRPAVVNLGSLTGRENEVLAGNHTMRAAIDEGWTTLWAALIDVDDEHAARIAAADNRTSDLGDYDNRALADLLAELPDLDGTGYDQSDLDRLLAELEADDTDTDVDTTSDDDPGDPPAEPQSAPGDVYQLGEHVLVVADGTDTSAWEQLLGTRTVDAVWTAPPAHTPADDLSATLALAYTHSSPGACWYVCSPAGPDSHPTGQALLNLGVWRQTLTWTHDQPTKGEQEDYRQRHNPIFYGWTSGASHTTPPGDTDTVIDIPRPVVRAHQPATPPVELVGHCLGNSTRPGALVLDPYAGAGSTLIAAHRRHLATRLLEKDPRNADMLCARFQRITGIVPKLGGYDVDFLVGRATATR